MVDAAGGDHRDRGGIGQCGSGFHVTALHHAVLGDVGIDDGGDAIGFKTLGQVDDLDAADLGPAIGSDKPVFGIETDNHLAREGAAGLADEFRLFDRLGADDHVADPGAHVFLDGLQRANAATDLDRQVRVAFGNGGDGITVDRLALKSAIEVNQMQAPATGFDPLGGHGHRVVGKHRGIVHQALAQAHTGAVFEVNSGNDQHRGKSWMPWHRLGLKA